MILRAIDLCCGAGGWACAARGLPIRVTHAFDRWHDACMTYKINHPETTVVEIDLAGEAALEILRRLAGRVDVVLGGIPCEWLSVYRNGWNPKTKTRRREMQENRTLLDAVLDAVKALAPRWWCLEDVTGLVRELPPLTPYQVLDAQGWSAQRRKRVFVGEFPRPTPPGDPRTLADHLRPGPWRIGRRTWPRTPAKSRTHSRNFSLAADPANKAPTVCAWTSRRDAEVVVVDPAVPGGKRQLEWQELARLQGFPDDYLFYGIPTSVGKQVGQAIQIDLGRAILEAMCHAAGAPVTQAPSHPVTAK